MKQSQRGITALAVLLVVNIGLGSAAKSGSRERRTQLIVIENMKFAPARVIIQAGDTVEFKNADLVPHNVTERGAKQFDSGMIVRNESWKFVADREGTFEYRCIYHPDMTGTMIVDENLSSTAAIPSGRPELCGDP